MVATAIMADPGTATGDRGTAIAQAGLIGAVPPAGTLEAATEAVAASAVTVRAHSTAVVASMATVEAGSTAGVVSTAIVQADPTVRAAPTAVAATEADTVNSVRPI